MTDKTSDIDAVHIAAIAAAHAAIDANYAATNAALVARDAVYRAYDAASAARIEAINAARATLEAPTMKFTAIYTHTWYDADDHAHQTVHLCRTEKRPDETIEAMIGRYGLKNFIQFLFLGNPQLLQDKSTTEETV